MSPPSSRDWTRRVAVLAEDPHLRSQVDRLMEPLRLIRGHKDAPTYDEVVSTAAQLVALLELDPDLSHTANNGGLMAVRGPMVGYSLLLHAADVYVDHLSPYRDAAEHWQAGQKASAERSAEASS